MDIHTYTTKESILKLFVEELKAENAKPRKVDRLEKILIWVMG